MAADGFGAAARSSCWAFNTFATRATIVDDATRNFLEYETRALMARLARMKPFALQEAMVPAAGIAPEATHAIERFLAASRQRVRDGGARYLAWLQSPAGRAASAQDAQRRFTILRLHFGHALNQYDLFADVFTQRSERDTGVWLAGLDVVAADALVVPDLYEAPSVICYLDRGVGAAIRRARTRLPGGGENPVAVIRVPRERMVGTSIASSLVHEVGHQAAALLDLVNSLRAAMQPRISDDPSNPWNYWFRWISEIVADFWSVARLGICSTLGLIGVVSLPRPFVFRISATDPHPFPWIRVMLSCAIGRMLFPHAQWQQLSERWQSFYPLDELPEPKRALIERLLQSMPEFLTVLLTHQSAALRGKTLESAMETSEREPARLAAAFARWNADPEQMYQARPALVFAALGQARADGKLRAEEESQLISKLLTHWALRQALDAASRYTPSPSGYLPKPAPVI